MCIVFRLCVGCLQFLPKGIGTIYVSFLIDIMRVRAVIPILFIPLRLYAKLLESPLHIITTQTTVR